MCSDLQAYNFDQCVNIIIMDMAWSNSSSWRQQVFNDSLQFNYRDLEQKGPTFVVFIANPQNAQDVKEGANVLKKVLSKEYGRNMDGFVHDFCVTVGADGQFLVADSTQPTPYRTEPTPGFDSVWPVE